MQVTFTRWSLDLKDRTTVAVNPDRVDCLELFAPATFTPHLGDMPAATQITMQGKQAFLVQGSVEEVAALLNDAS